MTKILKKHMQRKPRKKRDPNYVSNKKIKDLKEQIKQHRRRKTTLNTDDIMTEKKLHAELYKEVWKERKNRLKLLLEKQKQNGTNHRQNHGKS